MPQEESKPLILSQGASKQGVVFQLRRDPPGTLDMPGLENALVAIHVGPAARVACRRDGKWFSGTAVHGDIDIIPAHMPALWQMHDENDMALLLSMPGELLRSVAESSGLNPEKLELLNRYQSRDTELETLAWAIKREIENGFPSGMLYMDGLSLAVASRLVTRHSSLTVRETRARQSLSGHRLKHLLSFIEENIAEDLSLGQLAGTAGMSQSHLKSVFREATGTPVHQYVIQRRVDHAKRLMQHGGLTMAEIAQAAGFAHQSHMARHLRRAEGAAPMELRRRMTEMTAAD